MSHYLPITPEQIATVSIDAAEAGAAIIHLHARNPNDGSPTPDPAVFMRFLPVIKQSTDAVINVTTGGGLTHDAGRAARRAAGGEAGDVQPQHGQHELQHFPRRRPHQGMEVSPGRSRISTTPTTSSSATPSRTSKASSRSWAKRTARRFEFECYDIGHLYNLAYCLDRKIVEPPLFVQSIFGITGRHRRRAAQSAVRQGNRRSAVRDRYVWSVLAAGRHQMAFTTMAGINGGNVRVGLEDSLYIGKGELAKSNAQQVAKIKPHPGGTEPGDRHADGGAGDPAAEGRRSRWVLGRHDNPVDFRQGRAHCHVHQSEVSLERDLAAGWHTLRHGRARPGHVLSAGHGWPGCAGRVTTGKTALSRPSPGPGTQTGSR